MPPLRFIAPHSLYLSPKKPAAMKDIVFDTPMARSEDTKKTVLFHLIVQPWGSEGPRGFLSKAKHGTLQGLVYAFMLITHMDIAFVSAT